VFINDKGCGRIGDDVDYCTRVATGSPNTFAGPWFYEGKVYSL